MPSGLNFLFKALSGTIQGCPLSSILLNIVLKVLAREIRQKKMYKSKRNKYNVFVGRQQDITKKPKDTTKKLLELVNNSI